MTITREQEGMAVDEVLLTPKDVAAMLQVNVKWVYAAAARKEFPSVRVGKFIRFKRDEINAYIHRSAG